MIVTFCHYRTLERMGDAMSPVIRAGLELDVAPIMVRSVKEQMPDAKVVMLTDEWTEAVEGVDEVIRRPRDCPMPMHRLEHWAHCPYDEWVTVDTDVVFQAPIDHVFKQSFDVALTKRRVPLKMPILPEQHYNIGVMFSRCPEFWQVAWEFGKDLPYRFRELFMADQLSVCATATSFDVLDLPMAEFNYKPRTAEDIEGARVVHYAGIDRKRWMLSRYASSPVGI